MRAWTLFLGGLIVWTVHFFSIYTIASIFLTSTLSRLLTLAVTAACLAADAALLLWAVRDLRRGATDEFAGWLRRLAALIAAISFVAVLWQGLPALLV